MTKKSGSFAFAAVCIFALCGAARADEEMERILDLSMPYMHYSCGSDIENFGEDDERIAEIVSLMAKVSL